MVDVAKLQAVQQVFDLRCEAHTGRVQAIHAELTKLKAGLARAQSAHTAFDLVQHNATSVVAWSRHQRRMEANLQQKIAEKEHELRDAKQLLKKCIEKTQSISLLIERLG